MKTVENIIEDIQQAIVDAGGRFMRQKEIGEMKTNDLLNLLLPNHVEFEVKHTYKLSNDDISDNRNCNNDASVRKDIYGKIYNKCATHENKCIKCKYYRMLNTSNICGHCIKNNTIHEYYL